MEQEDSPVGCLQLKHVGLLLVVYSLYGQGMMHADGILQVLLRQGLLRFVIILQDNITALNAEKKWSMTFTAIFIPVNIYDLSK